MLSNILFLKMANFLLQTATTKILEMLFALNWAWYFLVSLIPRTHISGSLLSYLDRNVSVYGTIAVFLLLTLASWYALVKNIVWLRKVIMFFNISLCFLSAELALFGRYPPSAGAGFVLILGILSVISVWKITVSNS